MKNNKNELKDKLDDIIRRNREQNRTLFKILKELTKKVKK